MSLKHHSFDEQTSITSNSNTGSFQVIHKDAEFFDLENYQKFTSQSLQIEHDSKNTTVKISLSFSPANAVELRKSFAKLMVELNNHSYMNKFYLDRTHFCNVQCQLFSDQFNPEKNPQTNHNKQNSFHNESNQFAF